MEKLVYYLTLYTFSTENWRRHRQSKSSNVSFLKTINIEIRQLHKNNVKFTIIGELESLPTPTVKGLKNGVTLTSKNSGLNLCLALNYEAEEILDAVKSTILKVQKKELDIDQVDEAFFQSSCTQKYPDPDLLIRTSGEYRLSNFIMAECLHRNIFNRCILA